tara:strand:- start:509 stop:1396 length:888 start_codon:yes stop_codon:yes gene_type:complete
MKKIIILIPIYNDWKSLLKLLKEIDLKISGWDAEVSVIIINDASSEPRAYLDSNYKKIQSVKIINMKKNKGHARCNAAGLKYIVEKENANYVILMDGDGEDRPDELSLLFNKSKVNPTKIVTADRIKRSEGAFFKLLYEIHKILTYIFTGKLIKFGNYSLLPKESLIKLVEEPSLWSSFSGTLMKIVKDRESIPSIRGKRYFGPSQMNLLNLLIHSFSIIAVFKISMIIRSIFFMILYLFFISSNFSIITLFPVLVIFVFMLLIFTISFRENSDELNKSLENIDSIDILGDFNSR